MALTSEDTMADRKPITGFELIDHGIENSQYFQGCGPGIHEDVATGIGSNPAEAVDDALESLAQNDWDVDGMESRICKEYGKRKLPTTPKVTRKHGDDCYYYVSIRVTSAVSV